MPALRLVVVDLSRPGTDRHAVAHLIAEHRADVAVVHGAPSLLRWRSTCAAIAREAGLVVVGGGRSGGGNLLLADLGVDADAVRELSFTSGVRPPGATVAALRRLGAPFVLAGARLSGPDHPDHPEQQGGLRTAIDTITLEAAPAIVAIAGTEVVVDDEITVSDRHTVGGGIRLDLRLAE